MGTPQYMVTVPRKDRYAGSAVNANAPGVLDVVARVVRAITGEIVSGTVDVLARLTFAASVTATGLFIWEVESARSLGQCAQSQKSPVQTFRNARIRPVPDAVIARLREEPNAGGLAH